MKRPRLNFLERSLNVLPICYNHHYTHKYLHILQNNILNFEKFEYIKEDLNNN